MLPVTLTAIEANGIDNNQQHRRLRSSSAVCCWSSADYPSIKTGLLAVAAIGFVFIVFFVFFLCSVNLLVVMLVESAKFVDVEMFCKQASTTAAVAEVVVRAASY